MIAIVKSQELERLRAADLELNELKRKEKENYKHLHREDLFNVHHPEFKDSVEPAFVNSGIQYYRFKAEVKMPWTRYQILQAFLVAQDLKMDPDLLAGYVQIMRKAANGSKGIIDLTVIFKTLDAMESRMCQAFEVDTTYSLASVIYFDETEDLYSYNRQYNEKKVAAWKEARVVDFFYTKPMDELLGLKNISPEDLTKYIEDQLNVLKDLTIETSGS